MNGRRLVRRRILIAAVLFALFTITGFFILPPIVRSQLQKQLSSRLGRTVTIERVRMNPYTLSVTVDNLAIRERDGKTPFLGWRRLYVNFDALHSLWGAWTLSDVVLDGFRARAVVNPDRTLNVTDLLERFTAAPGAAPAAAPQKPGRPLRIGHLQVVDAQLDCTDNSRAQPFTTRVGPVSFDLRQFQTAGPREAPYRFSAVTEAGEKLAWTGTIRAVPFQSAGELKIENLVLKKYAPYYADLLHAQLASGTLSVEGRYAVDLAPDRPLLQLEDGAVHVRQFVLREPGVAQPMIDLPAVDITGIRADGLKQTAAIAAVTVSGGTVQVRRDSHGAINLLSLMPAPATPTAPAAATAGSVAATSSGAAVPAGRKGPDVTVAEFRVKDFRVDVADEAAPRPARLAVTGLQLSAQNLTLADGASIPLDLSFGWAPQGTVHIAGHVVLAPLAADLKIATEGLALLPLSPYLEQYVNAHLTQGALTTALAARVSIPTGQAPAVAVTGDVKLEKLGLVDAAQNEELAGVGTLSIRGLRAATQPEMQVAMDEVDVAAPYARVLVAKDGALNLAGLAKSAAKAPAPASGAVAAAAAAPQPASPPPVKIDVGKVVISDGDFRYADRSVTPGVAMTLQQFGGTITGLSSTRPAKGNVDLKAMVDGAGPVAITGKLDPFGATPAVNLKVDVKNVDLVPLSPYSGKYAGYELARGKLLVDVNVAIDGKKLDSTNVITLNHFTFGGPVQSADATKLPVRLAIALLKDVHGNVVIDVPVQGRTDDPNFRVGRVVLRVIVNLLTKAAVSPFSLLGAAFGGGGDELAYQEFAPGASELQPSEMKKLETMARALSNRPALSLDLRGSYDAAADTYALKRLKLAARIRRAVWEQKRQVDPNIPPPDQLAITPQEVAAMTKTLFDQTFPPGTKFGTPLPPPPAVVPPPPAPRPGFFMRIVQAVTFANARAARKAAAEKARLDQQQKEAVAAAVAAGLPLEEMTARLAETMPVDEDDLRALAQARAERVRAYFLDVGKIAPERLFLAKSQPNAPAQGAGPRVFLSLE